MKILNKKFYLRDPQTVAKDLLGKLLVRESAGKFLIGKVVEVEAYLFDNDKAAHSSRGKTKANQSLFLEGGHAYVHQIHKYFCLDAVCQAAGVGGSVLIRALEPIECIEEMKKNRNKSNIYDLTSGPGKICTAFQIDKSLDGIDLTDKDSKLKICESDKISYFEIESSQRIGISKSKELEYRYFVKDSKFVSK